MKLIEHERLKRGWSRQTLATAMGTSGETVYRLERDRMKLTLEWLTKFATAFDIEPAALLDSPQTSQQSEKTATPESDDIVTDWGAVSAIVLPGRGPIDTFRMNDNALSSVGILEGDTLFLQQNTPAQKGEVVIIEVFGSTRIPKKLARLYDPPYLISFSTDEENRKPILIESAQVKIIGVVQAVMRLSRSNNS